VALADIQGFSLLLHAVSSCELTYSSLAFIFNAIVRVVTGILKEKFYQKWNLK